jgi:caffeoyl-CoA O-methyltransferase
LRTGGRREGTMSELFTDQLVDYIDGLVPPRHPELQRMEAWAAEHTFPIIGPAAGQCCYVLSRLIAARKIFELGSGYGYSTAWFARAVRENGGGEVHHVVWDEQLSQRARQHLAVLGLSDLIRFHVAEAVETLKSVGGTYDIIFNDILKNLYPASIPVVEEHLRPGGLMIIDNMLWHARIFDATDRAAETEGVREATRILTTSDRWLTTLIPVRDGMLVCLRK